MIINSSKEFLENINKVKRLELNKGIYILDKVVSISNSTEIIGNDSLIIGNFILSSDLTIRNVDLQNYNSNFSLININKTALLILFFCNLYGKFITSAVTCNKNLNSEIHFYYCSFSNFQTALYIEGDNFLYAKNCTFQYCNLGINLILNQNNSMMNSLDSFIVNNIFNGKSNDTFLKIKLYSKYFCIYNVMSIMRKLYLCNFKNQIYLMILNDEENLIKTLNFTTYNILNSSDMLEALNDASEGNVLLIKNSIEASNFTINKDGINIMGDANDISIYANDITPSNCGFIINSSHNYIFNLTINGGTNYGIRDGIKFESIGGTNNVIHKVNFNSILRRGVSLWGENTNNTTILQCSFNNIIKQYGIHTWNTTIISDCNFSNMPSSIKISTPSKLYIINNKIINCSNFLNLSDISFSKNIFLHDNSTKNVKSYLFY